jgi:hypothetical protein
MNTNDDSQSFLDELSEIEEIDESEEQLVLPVSTTGSAEEVQTVEFQITASTDCLLHNHK